MAIKSSQELKEDKEKEKPIINTHGIIPLRYYRHYKGGVYFVNGFAIHEKTGKTTVIYTDGYNSLPFVRLAEEFMEEVEYRGQGAYLQGSPIPKIPRFELVEKK